MRLARPNRPLPLISIIPLVDVLMILLVFFLVTSTFLDLDMLPLAEDPDIAPDAGGGPALQETILLRILPGGMIASAGTQVPPGDIAIYLAERLAIAPASRLLLLPSPQADVQALVSVLDAAARAGIADIKVIRFGANP